MVKVGINGFGSIGRRFLRIAENQAAFEIVAINDLTDAATLAHLLKYDSNYGVFSGEVAASDHAINVNGRKIQVLAERNPAEIPWRDLGVDVVIEATGFFTEAGLARAHIEKGGAKRVIISAPATNADVTIVMGVNESQYDPDHDHIISNASCTTNCLAPIAKVLDRRFGIESGLMTTIHSYTTDQRLLDLPHHDLRRARAAALNIIPTSTGAAKALHLVLPQLEGKLNGISIRVPSPVVSLVDLTVTTQRAVSADVVNQAFLEASHAEMKGIIEYSDLPLVSVDFKGNAHSAIFDSLETMNIGDHLVKVLAWYDNEWGYASRLADLTAWVVGKGV